MLFMFISSLLQSSLIVEMQEMSAGAAHQTVVVTTAAGNKVKTYRIVKILIGTSFLNISSHIQRNVFNGQCHLGPFKWF